MSTKVKVSVIIPAYNTEKYIEETIESVINQQFNSFEVIIINDASTDRTLQIANKFKLHPKVKIFSNRKNMGDGVTRNRLIAKAQGSYITPCDSDDLMLPNNLSRLSKILDSSPKIGAVYGDIIWVEMDKPNKPCVCAKNFQHSWDIIKNATNHAGAMFRKNLMQEVGGYDERFRSHMLDRDLWMKLSEITEFQYLQGEFYYLWRRHSASLTRSKKIIEKSKIHYRQMLKNTLERRYGKNHDFSWLEKS